MNTSPNAISKKLNTLNWLGTGLLLISALIFLVQAYLSLNLFEFGDETEKFVAAQMIGHGMHLYRDIFANHGPLLYLVAHLYTCFVSTTDFTYIRYVMILLTLISAASLYFSPALKHGCSKGAACGLFLLLLSPLWALQLFHMLFYYQVAGLLFMIPVFQLWLPLFFNIKPSQLALVFSGLTIPAICFTAYSFGIACLLLVFASLLASIKTLNNHPSSLKKIYLPFLVGLICSFCLIVLWMLLFADLKGFFIYHFYFNQYIYAPFINFSATSILNLFTFTASSTYPVHAFALILFFSGILVLASTAFYRKIISPLKLISLGCLAISILYLNPRGQLSFQDNAFIIFNLAFFPLAIGLLIETQIHNLSFAAPLRIMTISVCIALCLEILSYHIHDAMDAGIFKQDFEKHRLLLKPQNQGDYRLIRSLVKPNETVLSLIYRPIFYIFSDRAPASGQYYYLPFQAAYNKKSIQGYRIDICADIRNHRPVIIYFDNLNLEGRYPVATYEPCIPQIIHQDYIPLKIKFLYLRKDLKSRITL